MLDDYIERETDASKLKGYLDRIIQILRGNANQFSNEDPYLFGWYHWWTRVKKVTHHEWQERFIDNTTNYLNAQIWELNNRIKKQIPSIEDYLIKRQHTGGVLPFFDLIEVVARVYLPPEAMNSLVIELISAANNLLAWSNDIMSLKKRN